jgi:hypothetical protein
VYSAGRNKARAVFRRGEVEAGSNTGAPCGIAGKTLTASRKGLYVDTFNGNYQQHVNFIGADNHVHELVYSDRWYHNDLTLTQNAGAPSATPGSGLAGYQSTFNNNDQQHVNFVGTDNHVHELGLRPSENILKTIFMQNCFGAYLNSTIRRDRYSATFLSRTKRSRRAYYYYWAILLAEGNGLVTFSS